MRHVYGAHAELVEQNVDDLGLSFGVETPGHAEDHVVALLVHVQVLEHLLEQPRHCVDVHGVLK